VLLPVGTKALPSEGLDSAPTVLDGEQLHHLKQEMETQGQRWHLSGPLLLGLLAQMS
jgi:hypothetical protein